MTNISCDINNVTSAPVLPNNPPKLITSSSDILLICIYNHGNKLSGQLRKTGLYLTPQAM